MRFWAPFLLASLTLHGQETQTPKFQPNWPCTGQERSFDPVYAKTSEATGGQVFLFDRSEAGRTGVLIIGSTRHPETILRSAGKLETQYVDIRVPVDSTIESLFVSVSLQCMQGITLYDPQSRAADPVYLKGEDNWFRAGRIATLPRPQAGVWTLRLMGSGAYFVSIKAKTRIGLHNVKFGAADRTLSLWLSSPSPAAQFQLVNVLGEPIQALVLEIDAAAAGHWIGSVIPPLKEFRVAVTGTDEQGFSFLRTDPRLFEAR
jgi:hypothetical protein